MRYSKNLEADTKERDAALVNELWRACFYAWSEGKVEKFDAAAAWFQKKHECHWQEHVKPEERIR